MHLALLSAGGSIEVKAGKNWDWDGMPVGGGGSFWKNKRLWKEWVYVGLHWKAIASGTVDSAGMKGNLSWLGIADVRDHDLDFSVLRRISQGHTYCCSLH